MSSPHLIDQARIASPHSVANRGAKLREYVRLMADLGRARSGAVHEAQADEQSDKQIVQLRRLVDACLVEIVRDVTTSRLGSSS